MYLLSYFAVLFPVLASLDQAAASKPQSMKRSTSRISTDGDDEPDENVPPPKALAPTCILKPYQMEGLTWLVSQYNKVQKIILCYFTGYITTAHHIYSRHLVISVH